MTTPLVSIALVTRNGLRTLPALLDAVARQRADFRFEVVAVDSGSTDGSLDLLRERVARVISIPSASFNHGTTRNLAVENTRGQLVVLIVQDAIPASDVWLASLVEPLQRDDRVAGSFARQLPSPAASALTRMYLERAAVAGDRPRTLLPLTASEFDALDPLARLQRCSLDNVCSCVRRLVWCRTPFRETPIAEDVEWAREVLLAGYQLEFVPSAAVFHSHDRSPAAEFERTRVLHQRLSELFGVATIPTLPLLARAVGSCLVTHIACERRNPAAWPRAAGLALAWPLGQYLGARDARGRAVGNRD